MPMYCREPYARPAQVEGRRSKVEGRRSNGREADECSAKARMPLQETQVMGLADSRLRPHDCGEGLLFLFRPARKVREEVEREGESCKRFPLRGVPAAQVDAERASDARLAGAADLRRIAAEVPGHAAGDSECNVAYVEGIP